MEYFKTTHMELDTKIGENVYIRNFIKHTNIKTFYRLCQLHLIAKVLLVALFISTRKEKFWIYFVKI